MAEWLRLDKYLADMGVGSRTEVKGEIKRGKVMVDGMVVKRPEAKIDAGMAQVLYMGSEVVYEKYEYIMLYKPSGVITATTDRREKTVLDLIFSSKKKDLFPVGRLDKDTEGLLLLTNDGDLAHALLSPQRHIAKTYYAKVEGEVTEEDGYAFLEGVYLGGGIKTRPGKLEILKCGAVSEVHLTIYEGKFHQVKRMFEAVGKKVIYLKRLTMGSLFLDEGLKPGEYRHLTEGERNGLLQVVRPDCDDIT